jgi:hypothetical protein
VVEDDRVPVRLRLDRITALGLHVDPENTFIVGDCDMSALDRQVDHAAALIFLPAAARGGSTARDGVQQRLYREHDQDAVPVFLVRCRSLRAFDRVTIPVACP